MSRSSNGRILRRSVRKGILAEIKRRTGRDASNDATVRQLVEEKIAHKEGRFGDREPTVADAIRNITNDAR